jgi:hypothetical protein
MVSHRQFDFQTTVILAFDMVRCTRFYLCFNDVWVSCWTFTCSSHRYVCILSYLVQFGISFLIRVFSCWPSSGEHPRHPSRRACLSGLRDDEWSSAFRKVTRNLELLVSCVSEFIMVWTRIQGRSCLCVIDTNWHKRRRRRSRTCSLSKLKFTSI